MIEIVRDLMKGHAQNVRVAAVALETIMTNDPDNDALIDEWSRKFGEATQQLSFCLDNYRTTRDVQGVA